MGKKMRKKKSMMTKECWIWWSKMIMSNMSPKSGGRSLPDYLCHWKREGTSKFDEAEKSKPYKDDEILVLTYLQLL